jgi:hypothetical protein
MNDHLISSVEELIEVVKKDYQSWEVDSLPWFRGEPYGPRNQLKPKLYRTQFKSLNELVLLRRFRNRAPLLTNIQIPQSGHTDQWLFLAQHVGLPTRLLDWTEGLLVALYFSLNHHKKGSVVWMLDPVGLNELTTGSRSVDDPLTWFVPEHDPIAWLRILLEPDERIREVEKKDKGKKSTIDFGKEFMKNLSAAAITPNAGSRNIRAAWEANDRLATTYPIAVHPTYIHSRISLQLSRFTVWGSDKRSLSKMFKSSSKILKRYDIDFRKKREFNSTLRLLGISRSSLFPDLDSLAFDLQNRF